MNKYNTYLYLNFCFNSVAINSKQMFEICLTLYTFPLKEARILKSCITSFLVLPACVHHPYSSPRINAKDKT